MSKDFVLKMGDGKYPPIFTVVARLCYAGDLVYTEHRGNPKFPDIESMSLSGSGTVESPEAIAKLRKLWENGEAADCELDFEGGQRIAGKFRLRRFALASDALGRLRCTISLVQADDLDGDLEMRWQPEPT